MKVVHFFQTKIFKRDEGVLQFRDLLIVFSLFIFVYFCFIAPVKRYGDGYEYLFMSQSFQNHLGPDLLDSDIHSLEDILNATGVGVPAIPYSGYYQSNSGALYSYHFWLYSLVNVPVKAVVGLLSKNDLRSFQMTNVLFFLFSLWAIYLWANIEKNKKELFIGVLALNPVLWYLVWWSPEVFTYSLVILSMTAFTRRQYSLASFLAATASAQNPPTVFLAVYFGVLALINAWPKLNIRVFARLIPAGLMAIAPSLFYFINFNTPSMIMKTGAASLNNITAQRVIDILLDLNSGILPYMPMVIILFFLATLKDLITFKWRNLVWVVISLALILSAAQTGVWNSDCAGLQRYAIWIMPLIVFYIFASIPLTQIVKSIWIIGIAIQIIIIAWLGGFNPTLTWLSLNPIAKFVLDHRPELYSPDPIIFVDRVLGRAVFNSDDMFAFYTNKEGFIRKMYTNARFFSALESINHIGIDIYNTKEIETIRAQLKAYDGFQYVNLSDQAIRVKTEPQISIKRIKSEITVLQNPETVSAGQTFSLDIKISNKGDMAWFYFNDKYLIAASYHWLNSDGKMIQFEGNRTILPSIFLPGEERDVTMPVIAPDKPGNYLLELDIVWNAVDWFGGVGNPTPTVPIQVIQ